MLQRIRALAKYAKTRPDAKDYLAKIFASKTKSYDMAIVLAAYRLALGEPPPIPPSALCQEAGRIAEAWFAELAQGEPVAVARSEAGMTTNYDVLMPSDAARAQERELRDREGRVYKGPRRVIKPVGYGDGVPLHWGAEFLRS